MKLYRAVSSTELADIRIHNGAFRDSPHLSGEKGFFFRQEDAVRLAVWASEIEAEPHTVVQTEAPLSVVQRSRPHPATHEGPGVYLSIGDLDKLTPAIEV